MRSKISCSWISGCGHQGWFSVAGSEGYLWKNFYCMFCLEVLVDGVRRFIYPFFHMGRWRFGKVCVLIHIYYQGFIQGVDDGCMLIVNL